ncbi:carbamoyl-phosphate synthase (glutamine-hydrolyzing) cpa2 [Elasticomyces elasticus]|nr:carbamoyl-phosphate synthase (glutamine-hydrolyzing) cpa2 [Elasticomyces elasticus]KAK4970055.1 hypothetical protein LTR42_008222 [Elasticomyces elasticus]
MAPPPTNNVMVLMLWLCWAALSLSSVAVKATAYAVVFPTEKVLERLLHAANVSFAPGLLDVLQSTTPPTIAFFKTLPTEFAKRWAVYLLVLEKLGCRPKIYVGSGTQVVKGVKGRLDQYDNEQSLPQYVQAALDEGFTITFKGLLCWMPIPAFAQVYAYRGLILTLETALAAVLWAMRSKVKHYGMPAVCHWTLSELEYDGCCSHNPLMEGITGVNPEELTAEQLTIVARIRAEKQDEVRKYMAKAQAEFRERMGADHMAEIKKRSNDKIEESGKYACNPCNHAFRDAHALAEHKLTEKHLNKVAGITKERKQPRDKRRQDQNRAEKRYYCGTCDYSATQKQGLDKHLVTPRHLKKVEKAATAASSS